MTIPCHLAIYTENCSCWHSFLATLPLSAGVVANNHRPFGPCLNTVPAVWGWGTGEGLSAGGVLVLGVGWGGVWGVLRIVMKSERKHLRHPNAPTK